MKSRTLRMVAFVAAAFILGACGSSMRTDDGDRLRSDPRVVRLEGLLGRSDTLLHSSLHSRYSLTAEGITIGDSTVEAMSCSGARCVAEDGTETTVQDLIDPSADIGMAEVELGMRGGFDTVTIRAGFEITESPPDVTLTSGPTVNGYGFWGEHGYAAVTTGAGPLSGRIEGVPFTGDFAGATAYAVGDASGTNPAGMGSATWQGIAEAASTGTFERHQGTATVTIADLSRPRVGVAIDVPGHDIGAPGWADMALTDGRFTAGTAGSDYLAGNFHGPDHEEAWGVFDTSGYVGAFGAKREP